MGLNKVSVYNFPVSCGKLFIFVSSSMGEEEYNVPKERNVPIA